MKTIYLTGAPAAGKSTTAHLLKEKVPGLKVWEYGAELTRYVHDRPQVTTQADLRRLSATVITPEDVAAVDGELLEFVKANRATASIIIDSHPVTKEDYGFRITAFSTDQITALAPDEVWVLFTPPEIAIDRIRRNAAGRPLIDLEQARLHASLQASVAASYGIATGRPVYLFDTSGDQQALIERLAARLTS
ncbi:AAA family ATPase [Rhizobium sp. WYCCWR 11152]|uniref:ATP-binding protein n=1 Tax=Rhizobium sp. WYCCWR 11152 TaxID=2692316 RepID=UPI001492F1A2|nr:ATP-binding protein [Rhizobium sp. WYCCWR 11152]NNU64356.1 AAA family ATPase [Rhizobium sp. WYCCWR 11152]